MTRLVVVGAGTAGIPAAITALEDGCDVVLIDKCDRVGGMLWASGAVTSGAGSAMQREAGVIDAPRDHWGEVFRTGRGRADPELLKLATEHAGPTIDWLVSIGTPFTADSPLVHGLADQHETYAVPRSYLLEAPKALGPYRGPVLAQALERALRHWYGVPRLRLLLRTRVVELIADSGAVIGVKCEPDSPDGEAAQEILGDAVILATGGYAASQPLLKRFHPGFDRLVSQGLPHATGDGIGLAESLGGHVVNTDLVIPMMGAVEDPARPGFRLADAMVTFGRAAAQSGDVWINKEGRRFFAEDSEGPDLRERAILTQPGAVMFALFDEPMRVGLTAEVGRWTATRLGDPPDDALVQSASSWEELARLISVPAEQLAATVKCYNAAVATGRDEFGRTAMPKQLVDPPFHAVRTVSTLLVTFAGLKVDGELRVLTLGGEPVPNLFAAGELLGGGQLQGDGFSSGMSVTPAIAFGRLAARHAVTRARARDRGEEIADDRSAR